VASGDLLRDERGDALLPVGDNQRELSCTRRRHPITSGPRDYGPVWSPDGTQIALLDLTHAPAIPDVVIINADGSGRHVVHHAGPQSCPPGSRIRTTAAMPMTD